MARSSPEMGSSHISFAPTPANAAAIRTGFHGAVIIHRRSGKIPTRLAAVATTVTGTDKMTTKFAKAEFCVPRTTSHEVRTYTSVATIITSVIKNAAPNAETTTNNGGPAIGSCRCPSSEEDRSSGMPLHFTVRTVLATGVVIERGRVVALAALKRGSAVSTR